ncbi:hypothetical protein LLH00_12390 [bacterium]|nr:hypothetical protein [bacterium]
MKTLDIYDYSVLVIYMALLAGIGIYFSRFMKESSDYFKAANKLNWWVAGLSSFMSAFSAWMFTGGAGIVYREGLTGMLTLGLPGAAIFTGYLLFAKLWRRSRVTTIMEYLAQRFNLSTHQVASWSYVPVYVLYSGAALFALSIFVATALGLDIRLVIWGCGMVILFYTLLGGLWAVAVNDTVQFLILLPVCVLLVPLSLAAVGGPAALVHAAPAGYFDVPTPTLPGHYMLAYFLLLVCGQNTNPIAQRYFSVRNEREARKVSLLCTGLFAVGIFFWAVPPMAARVLFPDLKALLALPNPDEGSYVVIALHLLPHGLMGLLVAAMFAATMSSLASIYNLLAGIVSKDIYQRVVNPSLSDRGLLRVARITTLAIGLFVIGLSLSMVSYGQSVFSVMMKISSLTIAPLAIPMLLGFLYRPAPAWSCLFSFLCSAAAALVFAFCPPLSHWLQTLGPWMEFTVSTLTIIAVGVAAFLVSPLLFHTSAAERERIEAFHAKLDTPVDEATEMRASEVDQAAVARLIGRIAMLMGALAALFVFIPASLSDRLMCLGLGASLIVFGLLLTLGGRKAARA